MDKEKFLEKMIDILDTEYEVTMDTALEGLEEWDSLSFVSYLAMVKVNTGQTIKPEMVRSAMTIGDLFSLIQA